MIKKAIFLAASITMLLLYSGCANCPIRKWCRGAACNTCQPPVGQPIGCGTNYAPSCDSGVCGAPGSAPFQSAPVMQNPSVNGPFIETQSFDPMSTPAPYYSSPATNGLSYPAPMSPSAEVYGNGSVGNTVSPPSIGPTMGSGSRN